MKVQDIKAQSDNKGLDHVEDVSSEEQLFLQLSEEEPIKKPQNEEDYLHSLDLQKQLEILNQYENKKSPNRFFKILFNSNEEVVRLSVLKSFYFNPENQIQKRIVNKSLKDNNSDIRYQGLLHICSSIQICSNKFKKRALEICIEDECEIIRGLSALHAENLPLNWKNESSEIVLSCFAMNSSLNRNSLNELHEFLLSHSYRVRFYLAKNSKLRESIALMLSKDEYSPVRSSLLTNTSNEIQMSLIDDSDLLVIYLLSLSTDIVIHKYLIERMESYKIGANSVFSASPTFDPNLWRELLNFSSRLNVLNDPLFRISERFIKYYLKKETLYKVSPLLSFVISYLGKSFPLIDLLPNQQLSFK
jgi:hypothetical protein